jgi:hypothetical protein
MMHLNTSGEGIRAWMPALSSSPCIWQNLLVLCHCGNQCPIVTFSLTSYRFLSGSIMERRDTMDYTYGLFVYEDAASLDFIGPSDVFVISCYLLKKG